MYQPGFVNRFVNNAFRKEKKRKEEERREIKPDGGSERRREGEPGQKGAERGTFGWVWCRRTVSDRPRRLVTPLSHRLLLLLFLLPLPKPASAQFGPVLALVTPPALTILHRAPTRPLTGPTDGTKPPVTQP